MSNIEINFFGAKHLNATVNSFLIRFADKEKMLRGALKAFFLIEEKMFQTNGGENPWQPLSEKYKLEKARLGYAGMPIMQMTGELRNALTGKDKSALSIVKTNEGFSIFLFSEYWHNHQVGSTIPRRMTVNFTAQDDELVIDTMLRSTTASRLSRLFTRG